MTKADKLFREVQLYEEAKEILNTMLGECIEEMLSIGIPVQRDDILKIGMTSLPNTHAVCCFKEIDGKTRFIIVLDKKLMGHIHKEKVKQNVRNSIRHELLHTCPNCREHNEEFLKWSMLCDEKLGAKTRCYLEDAFYYDKTKRSGFAYICPHCGNIYVSKDMFAEDIDCQMCGEVMSLKK